MSAIEEDDEEFIDFSTILSNTTTNSSLLNNDNSNILETKEDNRTSQHHQNVDFTWINNEFVTLGYDPILDDHHLKSIDQAKMASNLRKLLKTHKMLTDNYDNIRTENLKIKRENEFLSKRAVSVKEETNDLRKEVIRLEEKCKQLESKLDETNKRARLLDEDNRKMSNQIEQREKLFKIERTKFEKEATCLKEKIYNLSHEKNRQYSYLNICEALPNTTYSSNYAPLEVNTLKKQLELSSALIKDYDRAKNQLVIEINDLKTFICKILTSLDEHLRPTEQNVDNLDYEKLLFSFSFEDVYRLLNSDFEELMKIINSVAKSETN